MRAVLDVNVLISALISRAGPPAQLLLRWLNGEFELVVSEGLLSELSRALTYPKIGALVDRRETATFLEVLRATAVVTIDPVVIPRRSRDAHDDYLVALAESSSAILVSGDKDVLALAGDLPISSPAQFLGQLTPL